MLYILLGLLVLVLGPPPALSQYPWIQDGESMGFGQCASDADCSIYTTIYPSIATQGFFCNALVGRCQTATGLLLTPAFTATCPGIGFSYVSYRSLDTTAARADGIIVINVTASSPALAVSGAVRLYRGVVSNQTSNDTLALVFLQEVYIEAANLATFFYNLQPGTYSAAYFGNSGCITTFQGMTVADAMDGTYFPVTSCGTPNCIGAGVHWLDGPGFLQLAAYACTPRQPFVAYGIGMRCGLGSPWTAQYTHDGAADVGVPARVPFAQVLDAMGGVLATLIGAEVLWPGPYTINPGVYLPGGINIPPGAAAIPTIIATAQEASYLSGFMAITFGIGYGYRATANGTLHMLQTGDGKLIGALQPPQVQSLNNASMPPNFPPPPSSGLPQYDTAPMYFNLNGINTNTAYMYQETNIFAAGGNPAVNDGALLGNYPLVTILNAGTNQTVSVNALCLNGSVSYAAVYLDYTPYSFIGIPMTLEIMQVVSSSAGVNLVPQTPPVSTVITNILVELPVYQPGYYCAVVIGNLFDYGPRPLLQTCFPVGLATAGARAARSALQPSAVPHYPYLPFATSTTQINTVFFVSLPATLVLAPNLVPLVLITRFSPVASQEAQIVEAGAAVIDLVGDEYGSIDFTQYYSISYIPGAGQYAEAPLLLYTLQFNPYAYGKQIVGTYPAASSAATEVVAMARLFLIDTGLVPAAPPLARRRGSRSRSHNRRPQHYATPPQTAEEVRERLATIRKMQAEIDIMDCDEPTSSEPPLFLHSEEALEWGEGEDEEGGDGGEGRKRRRAESASASPAATHSARPTPSFTPAPHDYATPIPIPTGISEEYACAVSARMPPAPYTQLYATLTVQDALCPDAKSLMTATGVGGQPYAMDTPVFSNPVYAGPNGPPTTSAPPFTNPIAYYFTWTDMDTNTVLLSGVGESELEVPQNQRINVTVQDSATPPQSASAFGMAVSVFSRDFEMITFPPQVPQCPNGVTQQVRIPFALSNNNPGNVVTVQPTDQYAANLYDPNSLAFDIPANCSLLQNFSAYEVYEYCVLGVPAPGNATVLNCTACTRLPQPYPQVNGQVITTQTDNEEWTVIVWFITPFWNNLTQRYLYCQIQNATSAAVPQKLGVTFSQLTRIPSPPTCLDQNCVRTLVTPVLDPCYSNPAVGCYQQGAPNYAAQFVILTSPVMAPLGGGYYRVAIGQQYSVTSVIGNITFCPQTQTYTPSLLGPFIIEVQTTPSTCALQNGGAAADGSAQVFMNYNNPNPAATGTLAPLCFYWPNRGTPAQAGNDAVPIPFAVAVNAPTWTILPNSYFGLTTTSFEGISAGPKTLMVYDRCPAGDCVSCLVPLTFSVTSPSIAFTFVQFNVSNLANPAGGIAITRTGYAPAKCYNDTYFLNFTFVDTAVNGKATQNYEVLFLNPLGQPLQQWSSCGAGGRSIQYDAVPYGEFQVQWGPFYAQIDTGAGFGLGISGEYTFSVQGCTSRCVATSPTAVSIVQPLLINEQSGGTTCATSYGTGILQVSGGSPVGSCSNSSYLFEFPGNPILYCYPYLIYYQTPDNPDVWVQIMLPQLLLPGEYAVRAVDANGCTAQMAFNVSAPAAITASILGYNGVCQASNQSVVYLLVQGGVPPYLLLENVTYITAGDQINASFVARYNTTRCFHVIDSVGCIKPTEVCFSVPNPGPLNISVATEPSCANVATGSVTVTSPENIVCQWSVTGGTQPLIPSCTLVNLPPSAKLVLAASNIIGCVATATVVIATRPPILLQLTDRTTNGQLAGPCIDTITAVASGGYLGPPYDVSLFHDFTGANISVAYQTLPPCPPANATYPCVNGTANATAGVITVTGVCRSYVYTIVALEHDGECASTLVVDDPQFSFGADVPGSTIMGFGALNSLLPPPTNPYIIPYVPHGITWGEILFPPIGVAIIALVALFFINYS